MGSTTKRRSRSADLTVSKHPTACGSLSVFHRDGLLDSEDPLLHRGALGVTNPYEESTRTNQSFSQQIVDRGAFGSLLFTGRSVRHYQG